MSLIGRVSSLRWMRWLVLCTIAQLHVSRAEPAVSTLFVPDTDTIVSINLPPDSADINFYVSTPDWYQYTAVGFGSSMADALMLVMYPSASRQSVTVSPRLATGDTEPVWASSVRISLHESTTINDNFDMVVNATCHACRALDLGRSAIVASSETPMIFAVGPNLDLSSDDPDARIRRHVAYAQFTMDLTKATGPGGIGAGLSGSETSTKTLTGDQLDRDENKAATAHGVLYAIVALAVAPFDSLIAAFLGSRWAWLHGATATIYFAFVVGAMVPGVTISRQQVATQQFRTPHQVIGLLTFVAIAVMFFWGFALSCIRRAAKKRGQQPPESAALLGVIHKWVSWLVWILLLVNVGLGLKLSEHQLVVLLGYLALALGVLIILVPAYFCLWRCMKRRKEKEEGLHELTIYDHNYR